MVLSSSRRPHSCRAIALTSRGQSVSVRRCCPPKPVQRQTFLMYCSVLFSEGGAQRLTMSRMQTALYLRAYVRRMQKAARRPHSIEEKRTKSPSAAVGGRLPIQRVPATRRMFSGLQFLKPRVILVYGFLPSPGGL